MLGEVQTGLQQRHVGTQFLGFRTERRQRGIQVDDQVFDIRGNPFGNEIDTALIRTRRVRGQNEGIARSHGRLGEARDDTDEHTGNAQQSARIELRVVDRGRDARHDGGVERRQLKGQHLALSHARVVTRADGDGDGVLGVQGEDDFATRRGEGLPRTVVGDDNLAAQFGNRGDTGEFPGRDRRARVIERDPRRNRACKADLAVRADFHRVDRQTRLAQVDRVDRQKAGRIVREVDRQRFRGDVDQVDALVFGIVGQIANLPAHVVELRDKVRELVRRRRFQRRRDPFKLADERVDALDTVQSRRDRRNPLVDTVLAFGEIECAIAQRLG